MRLKEGKSGVLMRDIGLKPRFTFMRLFVLNAGLLVGIFEGYWRR